MQTNPSVILVREWEQQMSSSGCCGRLEEGDTINWGGERCFAERRRIMENVGHLYRAVRDRHGDAVEIRIVDPRNLPGLIPTLLGEFRRYGVPLKEVLRTIFGLKVNSVVVNGRLVGGKGLPDAAHLLELVDAVMPAASEHGTQVAGGRIS